MATAQAPVIKKRGNPNFGKQQKTEIEVQEEIQTSEHDKIYVFQLIKTHEKSKPVDNKTGEIIGSPYQPFFAIVNSGMAWDNDYITPAEEKKVLADKSYKPKKGAQRRWRYLYNYPTVWVDEQVDPEPTKEEVGAAQNDLVFRNGYLKVMGHETTKLQAIQLNNTFQGCERPLKSLTKEYVLLDQDKIDKAVLQSLDDSYEAEKYAREVSTQEMYSTAYFFGIDLSKSDDAIRKAFITVARAKPAVFLREVANPKNKYKYLIMEAMGDNIISTTIIPGKVCFVETGAPIMDVSSDEPSEEIASMAMSNVTSAVNLVNKIKKLYEEAE